MTLKRSIITLVFVAPLVLASIASADVLFQTGAAVQDRGWPMLGEAASLVEFGQPATSGFAIPFTATGVWRIDRVQVTTFGPAAVTGDGTPQSAIVHIHPDDGTGLPSLGCLCELSVDGISACTEYSADPQGLSLLPGNYWIIAMPAAGETRVGWSMTNTTGRVLTTIDAIMFRDSCPLPDQQVYLPAVILYGMESTVPVDQATWTSVRELYLQR